MDKDEAEQQIADLKRQLEAAQAQAPETAAGVMGALSPAFAVLALIPRWLIVAVGVVALSWTALEMYLNVRVKIAEVRQVEAQSCQTRMDAMGHLMSGDAIGKETSEHRKWEQDCRQYVPEETSSELAPTPASPVESKLHQPEIESPPMLPLVIHRLKDAFPNVPDDEIARRAKAVCLKKFAPSRCEETPRQEAKP